MGELPLKLPRQASQDFNNTSLRKNEAQTAITMNNSQFRRLVFDKPDGQNESTSTAKAATTPSTLGAKRSSFMPMTPRTVKGGIDVDFARQVRERNAALQPTKKFKTAAPKGVKYGMGYTDRARARVEAEEGDEEDEKAGRIKALEEQMKLGQIAVETFEALRDEITGGDVSSTHLVKGLDRKLLERVRRGEDVLGVGDNKLAGKPRPDVDEELNKLGDKEVEMIQREKVEKKGSMAPPPPVAGVKRSRNEIMAELKAQRKAAAKANAAPALDSSRWRKVGEKEKSRIEIDHKGRQVLITVDEDGVVKKKVRKVPVEDREEEKAAMEMPDTGKAVLGADADIPLSQKPTVEEEDEDGDIFEGVGAEYNPLGIEDEDDDDSEDSEDEALGGQTKDTKTEISTMQSKRPSNSENQTETPEETSTITPRNYFNDTISETADSNHDRLAGVQDLLKKAAKMDTGHSNDDLERNDNDQAARLKKRAEMLAQQDRDFEDMDMGFGSSRYDDGDEGEDKRMKLSEWKGSAVEDDDGFDAQEKGGGKKKRKPKKRKGDGNNMADVLRVIEGRKAAGGS